MGLLSNPVLEGEEEHWNTVLRAGGVGGAAGLAVGGVAIGLARRRYDVVRSMTLPLRAFLVTTAGAFGAVTAAERASIAFERARAPEAGYVDAASRAAADARSKHSALSRSAAWVSDNKISITLAVWAAGMTGALTYVSRSRYATTAQKVVQARVYAQGLTVAAILAIAAFSLLAPKDENVEEEEEGRRRRHPGEGQEMWKDMVAAEEIRLAALDASRKRETEEESSRKSKLTSRKSSQAPQTPEA